MNNSESNSFKSLREQIEEFVPDAPIPEMFSHIVSTEGTLGGKARINGTRISVKILAEEFMMGHSIETLIGYYPDLKLEQIEQALRFWMCAYAE